MEKSQEVHMRVNHSFLLFNKYKKSQRLFAFTLDQGKLQ